MQTTSSDRRMASAPVSIAAAGGIQGAQLLDKFPLDLSRRYDFVVIGTTPEQNLKQPGLQV